MTYRTSSARHGRVSMQPGSAPKKWDKEELRRCGAIGTTHPRTLNLHGQIHPVFANWADTHAEELRRELEQPLLLASRLLEAAGLPWTSDILAHDVFASDYAGRAPSCRCSFTHSAAGPRNTSTGTETDTEDIAPRSIVRHHRAPWATAEVQDEWVRDAEARLARMRETVEWRLDGDLFPERGWVGYTCRHPRRGMRLDELDRYETIRQWDGRCGDGGAGHLTVMVAAEFPARLAELRRRGEELGEEFVLTAFMAAVTILHELGHAVYWTDRRALTRDLCEPFYGADLEMELGNSFVASIFGGWLPLPIKDFAAAGFGFAKGIAWRQTLSWDFHRLRPKHRAHYSIPVDYVARLFSEESWQGARNDLLTDLIRPKTLELAQRNVGICPQAGEDSRHATAAIADFHCAGQGWKWDRLPGARFRIPQYDGYLCPDVDLPIATDDVIEESKPRPPLKPSPVILSASARKKKSKPVASGIPVPSSRHVQVVRPEMFPKPPRRHRRNNGNHKLDGRELGAEMKEKSMEDEKEKPKPKPKPPGIVRVAKGEPEVLSPDRSEISLDELRNRLSRLLGVSFDELERFFEASKCA
ncbi:hypothetical protein GGR54DRAFT_595588 [Hypoxylon sp. NC1633]|nr:hypothetical protein GGR54DRAFT_595588 [Hypoxylon sp. NC1633]